MARYPKQDDPDGENVVPSVTEIISDCTDSSAPLMQWSSNMTVQYLKECLENIAFEYQTAIPRGVFLSWLDDARFNFRKVSQDALDIGSEVHNAIEWYLKNGRIPTFKTQEALNAFKAFHKWKVKHNLEPIALEHTVYGNGWAGTLDIDCMLDDKRYIIDLKTSKSFYPEHRYQVAAYRIAVEDETQDEENYPQGCGILRLDKVTGLPSWHDTSKTFEKDYQIFKAMFKLYKLRHPIIMKRARGE